ncbi:3'-5' exonuclease [Devosia sp. A369]
MSTILAESFSTALAKLNGNEQKQAKLTVYDLQENPDQPGLSFHRIDKSRDRNFWSVRVSGDIRIIVHKAGDSLLLAYVDHHDAAYAWAERRVIDEHPHTGAIQIREVRELVQELRRPVVSPEPDATPPVPGKASAPLPPLFVTLSNDDLLSVGVPADWIEDVRAATDDSFFDVAPHLPEEAREGLLDFAATGVLKPTAPPTADPLQHPDTQRRFRIMEGVEAMQVALDAPFEKWAIFLHPTQRQTVERTFGGPARVVGSAGTGKTVVALHRVLSILQADLDARVLLTTFSDPLSNALARKLKLLVGERAELLNRVTIGAFSRVASQLYTLATGWQPNMATAQAIRTQILKAAEATDTGGITSQFLHSEWENVIDAWQIQSLTAYADVPRIGRKNRLGANQRERLWQVFEIVRSRLAERRLLTEAGLFDAVSTSYRDRPNRPFTHIVVDEAQDLGVPELRFLAAIAPDRPDALFFVGDLGQRIFRQPFSWKALGVDVRGRSVTLKVNYRTSHQIRRAADRLLPKSVRDLDGIADERAGTISVFNGPDPEVLLRADEATEAGAVAELLRKAQASGIQPAEIGVFVRSEAQLSRARAAIREAGLASRSFVDPSADGSQTVLAGTMHLAKGLEFRMVVLMACDQDVLPLAERLEQVSDEFELDEVLTTERQLLYVAATRARDRLVISAVEPGSEFIDDFDAN